MEIREEDKNCDTILSYKFTWVAMEELQADLGMLKDLLDWLWLKTFCSLFAEDHFQERKMDDDNVYQYCLNVQEWCRLMVAYIKYETKSSGMDKELKLALEKGQKIIVLIRAWLEKIYPEFIDNSLFVVRYNEVWELVWLLNWFPIDWIKD